MLERSSIRLNYNICLEQIKTVDIDNFVSGIRFAICRGEIDETVLIQNGTYVKNETAEYEELVLCPGCFRHKQTNNGDMDNDSFKTYLCYDCDDNFNNNSA